MGSTAIAISSANAAVAAAEAARAREEHKQSCLVWMPNYTDKGATVEQRYAYTQCVGLVYPQPVTDPGAVIAIKVALGLMFIGIIVGAIKPPGTYGNPDAGDRVAGAFMYGLVVPIAAVILGGLFAGACYLFGVAP